MFDAGEYTIDVDGATRRYASEKSGIVAEVNENYWITVRNTAKVPRKKPRTS